LRCRLSVLYAVRLTDRGNVWRDDRWGQSLIVWAIAEGRSAARGADLYLMGKSDLPAPLA